MAKKHKTEVELNRDDDYSMEPPKKHSIMAYIICVIAAVCIWLLIMNLNEPANIPLSLGAALPRGLLWV